MKIIILTPDKLLLKKENETFIIPHSDELSYLDLENSPVEFDAYDKENYSFICIEEELDISSNQVFVSFREIWSIIDEAALLVIGRAIQLGFWHRNSKFCGRCSSEFTLRDDELGKICKCGNMSYPAAFPAIIVNVKKGREILLVKTTYQVYPFHSSVAGFVDPGERLEDAVAREVMEEVGLEIENITYFDSQAFAPSNNIMIGFNADYKSGEITMDDKEIAEAAWFDIDNLPNIPPNRSLPWRMFEEMRKQLQK